MSSSNYSKEEALELFATHTKANTPLLNFEGHSCWARVVSVYDGDTITTVLEVSPGQFRKLRMRLGGIDTCEMKGTTDKHLAIAARNRLIELISGVRVQDEDLQQKHLDKIFEDHVSMVWLVCHGNDKWGRVLIDIYSTPHDDPSQSFNKRLINESLAYEYNGGTKKIIT